ncbi:MAG TPA: hypothetical protein VF800_19415 [Telluria sp.]|jgi:hypothetical protein
MHDNVIVIENISGISYPKPIWRYMLLFQSWSQLSSWLVIVLSTTLIMYGFFAEFKEVATLWKLFFGVSLGSLVSVLMVLPAQVKVSSNSTGAVKSVVLVLEQLHYVESHRTADTVFYRQKLPRFLRWAEGAMVVQRNPESIVIDGPRAVLGRVRAELMAGGAG